MGSILWLAGLELVHLTGLGRSDLLVTVKDRTRMSLRDIRANVYRAIGHRYLDPVKRHRFR